MSGIDQGEGFSLNAEGIAFTVHCANQQISSAEVEGGVFLNGRQAKGWHQQLRGIVDSSELKGFGCESDATIGVRDGVVESDGAVEVGIWAVDVRAISIRGDGTTIGGETADGELTLFWIGEA